jgi:hypothetical protein
MIPVTAEAELRACRLHVANLSWAPAASERTPIVTVYTTKQPGRDWLLGLSAALHGVPLVVGGLGGKSWAQFGQSNPERVLGYLRMFEVLQAMQLPATTPVAVVDSGDTVIVRGGLAQPVPPGVTASAECTSYPKCYSSLYEQLLGDDHRACLAARRPCFVNAGAIAASSIDAMLRLHRVQAGKVDEYRRRCGGRSRCESYMSNWTLGRIELSADQARAALLRPRFPVHPVP